ncbi:MAG: CO dehydrogenase/acetyl-CoA synthase subunit delta [Chloroflexi bacterium]|nr:CO dehydrogenase/acetyl-CoA synthase subunit delta [Chloroflexota bacterium]
MELVKEKWTGKVHEVIIGATGAEGGTRTAVVRAGGETTMPFYDFEGGMPNRPVLAMEVLDKIPDEPSESLKKVFGDVWGDPGEWARKCVEEFGAEMISVQLLSAHPDEGDTDEKHAVETVRKVLKAVGVPLIIRAPGVAEKDNLIIPAASQAAAGERVLLGSAVQDNYKTIVASALADGHCIITESPIDINIAKQVNILVTDMGFPTDRIVMDPTTGGLGYGLEYTFSIMERARLAALGGDTVLAQPFISYIGQESWRAKETKAENEEWGDIEKRAPLWEAVGAISMLQAGSDILVLRHPHALKIVRQMLDELMGK